MWPQEYLTTGGGPDLSTGGPVTLPYGAKVTLVTPTPNPLPKKTMLRQCSQESFYLGERGLTCSRRHLTSTLYFGEWGVYTFFEKLMLLSLRVVPPSALSTRSLPSDSIEDRSALTVL
jgi:hypothetical protein